MKHALLLSALILSPVLVGLKPAAVRVKFAPAEGTSLEKTFENKGTLTLSSYELKGAPSAPEMEMTLTTNQKIVVTDEYVEVKDGRPKKLKRSFDDLAGDSAASMKVNMMGQTHENDQNFKMESVLEGKKVAFTWNDESSSFDKAFDPAEENKELLEGLAEDMDLRSLLPEGEVKEGDAWQPDLKQLRHLFAPGGSLALVPEAADANSMKMGSEMSALSDAIGDNLEGEAKATLVSVADVDGVSCATIHIELKVHAAADLTDATRKMLEENDPPPGVESIEIDHVDMNFKFEGEGDLVWDVAAGHFKSFEMNGQVVIKSETGTGFTVGGKTMNIEETREMSGTTTYTASAK